MIQYTTATCTSHLANHLITGGQHGGREKKGREKDREIAHEPSREAPEPPKIKKIKIEIIASKKMNKISDQGREKGYEEEKRKKERKKENVKESLKEKKGSLVFTQISKYKI